MTNALRDNYGKSELSQLLHFLPALQELADHCSAGRLKYPDTDGVPNWLLGGKPESEYLDAAMRHLAAIVQGDVFDGELGTTHAAAVIWNLCVYVTCNTGYREPLYVEPKVSTTQGSFFTEDGPVEVAEDGGEPGDRRAHYEGSPGFVRDGTWYGVEGRKIFLAPHGAEESGVLVFDDV